jgi:hypothetical protein
VNCFEENKVVCRCSIENLENTGNWSIFPLTIYTKLNESMKVKLKYEKSSIKGGRSEEEWEKMKFFNIILCKWG